MTHNIGSPKKDLQIDSSKIEIEANQKATQISSANQRPAWSSKGSDEIAPWY